jgi:hypothetical protein
MDAKSQPAKDNHNKPAASKQSDTAGGGKQQNNKRFGGSKFKDGVAPWKRPREGDKSSGGKGNSGVQIKGSEIDTTLCEDISKSFTDTIILDNKKMIQDIDLVTFIQPLDVYMNVLNYSLCLTDVLYISIVMHLIME